MHRMIRLPSRTGSGERVTYQIWESATTPSLVLPTYNGNVNPCVSACLLPSDDLPRCKLLIYPAGHLLNSRCAYDCHAIHAQQPKSNVTDGGQPASVVPRTSCIVPIAFLGGMGASGG